MAVINSPVLSAAALGFGDLAARNAPQDGLLALVGFVLPASWFVRLLLLGSGLFGAYGALSLARFVGSTRLGELAAITLTIFNPFVIERLLQGQWSLVIAAWLLPGVAAWSGSGRWQPLLCALWLCSLTPTGAIFGLTVALVMAPRWRTALFGFLLCLPWLVPSVLSPPTSSGAGAELFASRAEGMVGTVGALLGLGGIWNSAAVPPSRSAGFALAGVFLFVLLLAGVQRVPLRLSVLGGTGLGAAMLLAFVPPLATFLSTEVPGGGLLRDSHKLLLLTLPLFVALVSSLRTRFLTTLAIALTLLQVWDAPWSVARLRPVPEPTTITEIQQAAQGRDVFVPGLPTLVLIDGTPTVNPLAKAVPLVENGALLVDGIEVDSPSPRFQEASRLWAAGSVPELAQLGIGVVYPSTAADLIEVPGIGPQRGWQWWLGLALLIEWLALAGWALGRGSISRRASAR
ncbi:hypothetical protein WG915_04005 [Corynebacterium sp. H128]|uniref:hypothetical protein n=1 Tax=Corynebacterium sp. H128 TaxID=3133427 RepID=UPI0030AC8E47